MKFVGFFIVILTVGFCFFWKRGPIILHGDPPASPVTETAATVPTAAVGIPSRAPALPRPAPSPNPHDITLRVQKIAELARPALPTQKGREALIQSLSDQQLQSALGRILEASDRLEYNADQEKQRMNAVSVLGLILKHKDVSHREDMVRWIRQRVLTVDFDRMKDIRVKQSVYGDITELLMILKQHDPEAFDDVAQRISETNRKVLKTALAASR
ncbi:MAG TPA: hypothetical protein VE954_01595 [Oligoflexus sp.]|uniref:hypothetical protein n=1 Tax=Oligoflexus sp. TaxID=1971216 RepID=UPI002D3D6A5E|nr:hypothetical protein [Oligoflexus sp.]HYX31777.1 hypothetical protein [Oligoflexus sp.]